MKNLKSNTSLNQNTRPLGDGDRNFESITARKKLNNNYCKRLWGPRATRSIIRGLLAALVILAVSGVTSAQEKPQDKKEEITSPTTPAAITPPAGNSAFLVGHAVGTQGYICLPTSTGASWTVNGARPEATLFTNIFGVASFQDPYLISGGLWATTGRERQTSSILVYAGIPLGVPRGEIPGPMEAIRFKDDCLNDC